MSGRRQDTHTQRREQIMKGALQAFAAKGFTQATNKDIAAAAGIQSPALIYHYFANKEALLFAVVEQYAPPFRALSAIDSLRELSPEQALTRLGMAFLHVMDDPLIGAGMRLLIGEATRSSQFAHVFAEAVPLRVWRLLAEYLQAKMEEGLLRRIDPAIAARCFVGPLVTLVIRKFVLQLPDEMDVNPESLVQAHVAIFLCGLQAPASECLRQEESPS